MNAFVKKEIRLLLLPFSLGCLLTLANLFWPDVHGAAGNLVYSWVHSFVYLISFVACPALVVMVALTSFGAEVSSGNLSGLLAQPSPRWKIWQVKIALLAAALLVIGILWSSFFYFQVVSSKVVFGDSGGFYHTLLSAILFGLVVFSGGLWTVLLLRQVAAAFWFTLLVPGVLLAIVTGLVGDQSTDLFAGMVVTVLGAYSLAGFFFARWLFLRAQDLQWSGGTITLPEMRGLYLPFIAGGTRRAWRPQAALWWKEIQFHQSQWVMAGVLAGLHLGVLAVRKFCNLGGSPNLAAVLQFFWIFWLVMPLLVGCAAVAEERKLGTLEGQLCLPANRRTQFGIKFFVALFLSILFGAVMPLWFEGNRILLNAHFGFHLPTASFIATSTFWNLLESQIAALDAALPLLICIFIPAVIGTVSFFVSSLARNTLQTLAPAVVGILLVWPLFLTPIALHMLRWDIGRSPLIYFIGAPLLALTLLLLAFGNFQQVRPGWKTGGLNLVGFVAALILAGVVTSAVYHRFWEKLTPFEPAHGPARLSLANPATMKEQWGGVSVRLPDGRIWMPSYAATTIGNPLDVILGNLKTKLVNSQFINGSNWVSVQAVHGGLAGIKADGTLWASETVWPARWWRNGQWKNHQNEIFQLSQFGGETNWNSLASFGYSALLVKNDGTLWQWGSSQFDSKHGQWLGLRAFTPHRLGTDADWSRIFPEDDHLCLQKTDGSIWTLAESHQQVGNGKPDRQPKAEQLGPNLTVSRLYPTTPYEYRSSAVIFAGAAYKVGVRSDGTFRIWAEQEYNHLNRSFTWLPTDCQIGDGTHWLAVAGSGNKLVTLKDDGSLWLWNFDLRNIVLRDASRPTWLQNIVPTRLGTHSDWVALAGRDPVSLAADGSLWFWPVDRAALLNELRGVVNINGHNSDSEPWLDISHKPQLLGNVFN